MKKVLIVGAVVLLGLAAVWYISRPSPSTVPIMPTVTIGTDTLHVTIADTPALRERGLGGKTALAPDEAMLFVFSQDSVYAFWMKDMRFAIDIIWIAADHTVVYMQENVSPSTYPEAFKPDAPARYVLETTSGYIRAHHVKKGGTVRF